MYDETIKTLHANPNRARRHHWLWLFMALVFGLTIYPGNANAQLTGNLEVDIPFAFHAGNAKLPAGKYIIRPMDDSDLTVMEISSADGSISALFDVEDAQANSTPAKSELIFNKYGNNYFLSKLFDEGNPQGSKVVPKSRYEKRMGTGSAEAAHVSAHHRTQQAG
jgi:hypothetical protein